MIMIPANCNNRCFSNLSFWKINFQLIFIQIIVYENKQVDRAVCDFDIKTRNKMSMNIVLICLPCHWMKNAILSMYHKNPSYISKQVYTNQSNGMEINV